MTIVSQIIFKKINSTGSSNGPRGATPTSAAQEKNASPFFNTMTPFGLI